MLGMSDVVEAALFAFGGTVVTTLGVVIVAIMSRGNRNAIREVHEEVRTNHGERAGAYIEQIPVLATSVQLLAGQVEGLGTIVHENRKSQEAWNVHHDEKDDQVAADLRTHMNMKVKELQTEIGKIPVRDEE